MEVPTSDLAQLWQNAVDEYEKRTKKSLHLAPFRSLEEVMQGTDGLSIKFKQLSVQLEGSPIELEGRGIQLYGLSNEFKQLLI